MRLTEVDLQNISVRRVTGPGRCIYCGSGNVTLTDEHVIPFALAANTIILERACCVDCQRTIQPYEQEVLAKQLGTFRAQVGAPSRTRKNRSNTKEMHFLEVNKDGKTIRDLGIRTVPIDEVPMMLTLWNPPPPTLLIPNVESQNDLGQPWWVADQSAVKALCEKIAVETESDRVAVKLADVSRISFLRFLAKTAHAYAVAELGLDSFRPFLTGIVLNKSDELGKYVGTGAPSAPFSDDPSQTFQISLGSLPTDYQREMIGVRICIYPMLKTPEYFVIVGEAERDAFSAWRGAQ